MRFILCLTLAGLCQVMTICAASGLAAQENAAASAAGKARPDYQAICFFAGVILVLLGLTKGIPAFIEWRRDKRLLLTGIETTGIINEATKGGGVDEEMSGSYILSAEFKSADGLIREAIAHFVVLSPGKFLNTEVAIIYDPEKPEHAQFKNEIHPGRRFFVLILYILMLAVGLGLFLYLYIVV